MGKECVGAKRPNAADACAEIAQGGDRSPHGSVEVNAVNALCSVRMKELMSELREQYDYVILDAPAVSSAPDAAILSTIVDGVLLVTSQQPGHTVKAISVANRQLDDDGANILGIVVNNVEESEYRRAMKNYDYFKKHKYKVKNSKKGQK